MKTRFLALMLLTLPLFAQGLKEDKDDTKKSELEQAPNESGRQKDTIKIYHESGNKIEEVWHNYSSGKGLESFLRFKTFYKGDSNIRLKKETYRTGDSSPNPKTIDYYNDAQKVYKTESFYPRLNTLKHNRKGRTNMRETLLNERRYFYTEDCYCIEVYDGYFEIQSKMLVKSGRGLVETKRTSSDQDLSCKEDDCK